MVENLTEEIFREKIFDFKESKEWKYKGDCPCMIDFYADWCGPCKMVAPIMDELADEYSGKVDVYKVDTQQEQELAALFSVRSIPTIILIPKNGKPQVIIGALSKEGFGKAIKKVLLEG
ncbi:thioredoxin [archaeon]|nr:thioredoxin [archaeon]